MTAGAADGTQPTAIAFTPSQKLACLRLARSENVGPITFRELVGHCGGAAEALAALPSLAARGGRRIRIASTEEAEREFDAIARAGARLVAVGESAYPRSLRHLDDAPPLLTVRGAASALLRPMVAIVGSRNASLAGRKVAMTLAKGVGGAGIVVVSGLARGIDAAAHEASLSSGTVAVLAGGLDRLYPPENAPLAERIVDQGGALVTEMPMGWEPRARDFPRRNRIVSGLALGVVIVEAAERSGSLITARLAGEQGRLVFAVPGSPLEPRATGTNRLIKEGAQLVTGAEDIIDALAPMLTERPVMPRPAEDREAGAPLLGAGDEERRTIVEALGPTPTGIDEIIRFTGLKPAMVHFVLLELDLAGRLQRHAGQRVSMI